MQVDKYWNDLLQVLTEDDLRIRRGDMVELEKSDIRDFLTNLKLFEDRLEQRAQQLADQQSKK